MIELPKPAFITDDEIVRGGQLVSQASDATVDQVSRAVRLGTLILESPYAYVRYLKKDGDLLYHIFRGEGIPEKFWGSGSYGLTVLSVAESYWPFDKVQIEYHAEVCRPEVVEDDPRRESKFPAYFYGAYLVLVPGIDRRLAMKDSRITTMASELDFALQKDLAAWADGS